MEFLISFLQACEEAGIFTGGSDPGGSYAFVVIDSKSDITIIVRPTGRITLTVDGEIEDFHAEADEQEDGEASDNNLSAFFSSFTEALVNDNLDSKAQKLLEIVDQLDDSPDEDSTEDDQEESDVEDDEDYAEEEDEDLDEVEEASGKVRSLAPKDDDQEEFSNTELSADELSLLVDNAPLLIDDMIEMAARGSLAKFDVKRFNSVVGIKGKKGIITYHTGAALTLKFNKTGSLTSTLTSGTKEKRAKEGTPTARLIEEYQNFVRRYGKTNNVDVTKIVVCLDNLRANIEDAKPREHIEQSIVDLAYVAGASRVGVNAAQLRLNRPITINYGRVAYVITVEAKAEGSKVSIKAVGPTFAKNLLDIKAQYTVSVAAGFAQLAAKLGSEAYPNGIFLGKRDGRFSNLLMRWAIKLGYRSEEDTRAKLAKAELQGGRETAAITKAQVVYAAREARVIANKNEYNEWRITLRKEEMPSEKRREDIAYYTEDNEEALHAIGELRAWADKHLNK